MNIVNKIGIFDSGVGGLNILKALQLSYPETEFLYFADNANLPYGDKTTQQIVEFSKNIIEFLKSQGVDVIIAACNTSSASAIDILRNEFDLIIIDIINPLINNIINKFTNLAVIATERTVQSNVYKEKFQKNNKLINIIQIPCKKLVPIIENGYIDNSEIMNVLEEYLQPVVENQNIEALIYGCTHYQYLHNFISKIINIPIINPIDYVLDYITKEMIINSSSKENKLTYFVTGSKSQFINSAKNLCIDINDTQVVKLNKLSTLQ